jgi:hypothetical protein
MKGFLFIEVLQHSRCVNIFFTFFMQFKNQNKCCVHFCCVKTNYNFFVRETFLRTSMCKWAKKINWEKSCYFVSFYPLLKNVIFFPFVSFRFVSFFGLWFLNFFPFSVSFCFFFKLCYFFSFRFSNFFVSFLGPWFFVLFFKPWFYRRYIMAQIYKTSSSLFSLDFFIIIFFIFWNFLKHKS